MTPCPSYCSHIACVTYVPGIVSEARWTQCYEKLYKRYINLAQAYQQFPETPVGQKHWIPQHKPACSFLSDLVLAWVGIVSALFVGRRHRGL